MIANQTTTERPITLGSVFLLPLLFLFCTLFLQNIAYAEETAQTKALKETEFLGLKLADADINSVRSHLWNVGGFLQAKSTVKQRNVDKFFPWSTIRDSYHVTFRYNHAGNLVTALRLYRPYSLKNVNKRSQINTKEIALKLIPELGQPTGVQRKSWGGMPSYLSYIWQDEDMKIEVDREGSEYLGNVFVKYTVKKNKRFEVLEDKLAKKMGI